MGCCYTVSGQVCRTMLVRMHAIFADYWLSWILYFIKKEARVLSVVQKM